MAILEFPEVQVKEADQELKGISKEDKQTKLPEQLHCGALILILAGFLSEDKQQEGSWQSQGGCGRKDA